MNARLFTFAFLLLALGCQRQNDHFDPCALTAAPGCSNGGSSSGAALALAAIDFGSAKVGTRVERSVALLNVGVEEVLVSAVSLGGDDLDQFALPGSTCVGQSLAAGASCAIDVAFVPTRVGAAEVELQVKGDGGAVTQATVAGEGTSAGPSLTASPSSLDFHELHTGQSASVMIEIRNDGDSALIAVDVAGDAAFQASAGNCGLLAHGGSCTIEATFAPDAKRTYAAQLVIAPGSGVPTQMALTGTGIDPAALKMSWTTFFPGQYYIGDPVTPVVYHVTNGGSDPTSAIAVSLDPADSGFVIDADGCSGQILAGGAACDVTVGLTSTTKGPKDAHLTASATAGGSGTATLSSWAAEHATLLLRSGSPDLGQVGDDATVRLAFINDGDQPTGILQVTLASDGSGPYSIVPGSDTTCANAILSPGDGCSVTIAFAPKVVGSYQDQLSIVGGLPVPVALPVSGSFVSANSLRVRPTVLFESFDGKTQTHGAVVENVTTHDVGPLVLKLAGDAGFALAADGCSGATLASGGGCILQISFTPTKKGMFSGELEVTAGADRGDAPLSAYVNAFPGSARDASLPRR